MRFIYRNGKLNPGKSTFPISTGRFLAGIWEKKAERDAQDFDKLQRSLLKNRKPIRRQDG